MPVLVACHRECCEKLVPFQSCVGWIVLQLRTIHFIHLEKRGRRTPVACYHESQSCSQSIVQIVIPAIAWVHNAVPTMPYSTSYCLSRRCRGIYLPGAPEAFRGAAGDSSRGTEPFSPRRGGGPREGGMLSLAAPLAACLSRQEVLPGGRFRRGGPAGRSSESVRSIGVAPRAGGGPFSLALAI